MLTRIFGAVTGGRLNLRAAANSSAAIIASIPNETLLILSEHNDMEYRVLPHGGEKNQRHRHGRGKGKQLLPDRALGHIGASANTHRIPSHHT